VLKLENGARTTGVFDAASQIRYTQDGSGRTTYTFDANGNQQSALEPNGDRTTYSWDCENQNTLVRLADGSGVTMTYNHDFRRVRNDGGASSTFFIWDVENDSYLMETDGAGSTAASYTNEPIHYGRLLSQRRDSTTSYYHLDGHGSTRQLTDHAQLTTDAYMYTGFGVPLAASGSTPNAFTYIGSKGYYSSAVPPCRYVRFRHYDSHLARWLSIDLLHPSAGASLYIYGGNLPIVNVDPSGAFAINCQNIGAFPGSIDPTRRDKLAGANCRFTWQLNDARFLVQKVEDEGSFAVFDDCGLIHSVFWTESYVEAWSTAVRATGLSFSRDEHKLRPRDPAQYLEKQSSRQFAVRGQSLSFGARKVQTWAFHAKATFTLVNASWPEIPTQPNNSFGISENEMLIQLFIDSRRVTVPNDDVFSEGGLLWAHAQRRVPRNFPPSGVIGRAAVSVEFWDAVYEEGDNTVTNKYSRNGYA
jgi:RHS repeat-associated protein